MYEYKSVLHLAGIKVLCDCEFSNTPKELEYFTPPETRSGLELAELTVTAGPALISERDWVYYEKKGAERSCASEYSLLAEAVSDALLPFDRIVAHAVALRWQGKGYLIMGPSGVGKSTQLLNLQKLRPAEFDVICGDRPVLQIMRTGNHNETENANTEEGQAIAYPSPWNGKENLHGAPASVLAGIILLQRGETNRLERLLPRQAVLPVHQQLLQRCWEPGLIRKAAALEDDLLHAVPVWRLTSFSPPASTQLLLNEIFQ